MWSDLTPRPTLIQKLRYDVLRFHLFIVCCRYRFRILFNPHTRYWCSFHKVNIIQLLMLISDTIMHVGRWWWWWWRYMLLLLLLLVLALACYDENVPMLVTMMLTIGREMNINNVYYELSEYQIIDWNGYTQTALLLLLLLLVLVLALCLFIFIACTNILSNFSEAILEPDIAVPIEFSLIGQVEYIFW